MRILHVITGLAKAAGTSTFCGEVCNQLAALSHDVTIAVCNPKAANIYPLDPRVHLVSIESIIRCPTPPTFSTFSLVHLHALWTPVLHKVSQWAHKQGIPVIWSTHGMTAPWSLHHKWWKKCLPWYLYQRRDLAKAQLIHCTSDFEVEWNQELGFKNCFVAPLGTNEGCLNADASHARNFAKSDVPATGAVLPTAQSAFREVMSVSRRHQLAEKKIEEWLEGVTRESFCSALERLVDNSIRTGELPLRSAEERQKILEGAQSFFAFFARCIVKLSDGRCVYFTPDPRSRLRKISNAQAWAEYAIHGVTNGGGAIPGKPYHMRWYNHRKVENADLIVPTLKAENCFDTLKKNPVADSIKFFGKTHEGGYFDVVVRLDEAGNANANMTEVTFEAGKDKKRKYPRFKPLAEAVEAVVCHQAAGTNPPTQSIVSKSSMACKGDGLKVLFVGRIYPVKGLVNLVKAAALVKQSNNLNSRTILFRIVGPDQAGHQAELMKLAEELGVAEMFEWPGPKFGEELSAEYDNCDLLVLPSFTENFGGVVIDALAHGKPVIASKFTPWKILEDEGCGWWVDNDPESLSAVLSASVDSENSKIQNIRTTLQELGRRGRKLIEKCYTWAAVCDKISHTYEEVLR